MLWWEDNQAVVGILRRLVARARHMRPILDHIIRVLEEEHILLHVRYVESAKNPSDWWSRVKDKAEWQLRPDLAHQYMHLWGPAQVDRFADSHTTQLRRFNAAYPEEPGASAVVLLPDWPTADWWPTLTRLLQRGGASIRLNLPHNAFTRSPLMHDDVLPEPLHNLGWRLRLVFIPATQADTSLCSAAMHTGAVLDPRQANPHKFRLFAGWLVSQTRQKDRQLQLQRDADEGIESGLNRVPCPRTLR